MIVLFLLGLACLVVYNTNLRQIGSGDTLPARYLPLILWRDGALNLDDNALLVAHGHSMLTGDKQSANAANKIKYLNPRAYWMVTTRQHQLASFYPVVTPLIVAPLYLPAHLWLDTHGWNQPQIDQVAEIMEKVSASILATIASMIMYLVLRRDDNKWNILLVIGFAFGTNTWMISSQALWQHGTGELLIALALLLVVIPASPGRIVVLGATCVLMVANRPPDALVAGAFILYTIWSNKRNIVWLLVGAVMPMAALLYYNLVFIGHIAGGYALVNYTENSFRVGWTGVAGLLVSPTRGLLIFSPFLIFVPVGLSQRLRSPDTQKLAVMLSVAVIAQTLGYSQGDWRAGVSWGARWLTDLLPILIWMLAPAPLVLGPFTRGLLILTVALSVCIQTIGAFWYTKISDERIFSSDRSSMQGAWDPKNTPFLIELQHPPAPFELLSNAQGSLDRVGPTLIKDIEEVPILEHGALLEGWALTGGQTPSQLLVLIDGIVIGSTMKFLPRADVNEAMQTESLSGWQVIANLQGVPPGDRVLQLAVRIGPRSDIRIIREQHVFVVAQEHSTDPTTLLPQNPISDSGLADMARSAVLLLQKNQSEYGFWLTMYTRGVQYLVPQPEMNTFLTSTMVDFLLPIAYKYGLDDVVERAQQHLAAQIESNGLVRYHGLPDGSTIGKLGCVITPDADDTALVWRIAGYGTDDPRLHTMLATLARYRDTRGLYRTWLAPQSKYRCIDPGSDPNPTDIGIQMNVYLMLRDLDPPAAQDLCDALQNAFWDGDVWVYYSKAPLLPYMRTAELRQLGCIVPLTTERLALSADGQEIWSEAVRLFMETLTSPPDKDLQKEIRNLLARLGNNDFEQLRNTPPMLYHNDLSASVSRFYWSEDFGYALWLRLYTVVAETGNVQ